MQDADFSAGLQAESLRTGMKDCRYFYIDGKWVSPAKPRDFMVVNPATEQPIATISLGSAADVEKAVGAAKRAFASYSETTVGERPFGCAHRSEEHTSELQSHSDLVCRLLLE